LAGSAGQGEEEEEEGDGGDDAGGGQELAAGSAMENFLRVSNLISVAFLLLGIASAIAALVFLAPTRDFVSWMRSRLAGWTVPPPGRLLRGTYNQGQPHPISPPSSTAYKFEEYRTVASG
jgi:hypothetical protein